MRLKKSVIYLLLIIGTVILLSFNSFAITGHELIDQMNQEIRDFYQLPADHCYFNYENINTVELEKRILEYEKYGFMLNPITYGSNSTTYIGYNHWNYYTASIGQNKFGEETISFFLNSDINQQNPDFVKMVSDGWEISCLMTDILSAIAMLSEYKIVYMQRAHVKRKLWQSHSANSIAKLDYCICLTETRKWLCLKTPFKQE